MPDVTSTLLAMYQQVIGGSTAREQSSVEAEAARRVVLSGLTINGSGTLLVPGTVVLGTVSVASLSVTGNATVGGTLTVTGDSNLQGNVGISGAFGLTVTNLTQTGTLSVTGAASVGGLLTVTGFGAHSVTASGTGAQTLTVRNTAAGTANLASVTIGNDVTAALGYFQALSSTFTPSGANVPSAVKLSAQGVGGLLLQTGDPSATIRFFTNGASERLRIAATGELLIGTQAPFLSPRLMVVTDLAASNALVLQNVNATNSGNFHLFVNSASGLCGSIAQSGATGVTYGTTSDARLKDDAGRATDLTALRGVVVHDFAWKADGRTDRGVFAQEAHACYPRAVVAGTDETTERGTLAHPWMTDYSKFVPDLIVGWQQHEAELVALRALLAQQRMD